MQPCFARAIKLIAHPKITPNSFLFMGIFFKSVILHTLKFHLHTLSCQFWLNLRPPPTWNLLMSYHLVTHGQQSWSHEGQTHSTCKQSHKYHRTEPIEGGTKWLTFCKLHFLIKVIASDTNCKFAIVCSIFITWTNGEQVMWHYTASLGLNELIWHSGCIMTIGPKHDRCPKAHFWGWDMG